MHMATAAPIAPGPFASGPVAAPAARDPRYDNQPPLEERLMLEFVEDLDAQGVTAKIAQLVTNAADARKCDSEHVAGQIGDFCKQTGTITRMVNDTREKYNRPLLTAQKTLKGKADALLAPLLAAADRLRADLNRFTREEAQRRAEEHRSASSRHSAPVKPSSARTSHPRSLPRSSTPKVEKAPIARGDYGSTVGTTTVAPRNRERPPAA
jgi:ABC-type transporter Mla subunit MlaD